MTADELTGIITQVTQAVQRGDDTLTGDAGTAVTTLIGTNAKAAPNADQTAVDAGTATATAAAQTATSVATGTTTGGSVSTGTSAGGSSSGSSDTSSSSGASTGGSDGGSSSSGSQTTTIHHVETNRYKAQAEAAVEKEMEQLTYERDAARWDATKAKEDLKAVNVELDGAKAYLDVLNENIDAGLDTAAGLNDEIASLRVTLADGREAETALVGRIHVRSLKTCEASLMPGNCSHSITIGGI